MKKTILLILTAILVFCSCEQTLDDAELLYEKKLVVRAFLYNDEHPENIFISYTAPPLVDIRKLDLESLIIKDAEVTISVNGSTFKCKNNGTTYYCDEIVLKAGETYHLTVTHGKMRATATTTIPDFEVDTVYYEKTEGTWQQPEDCFVYARIKPLSDLCCYTWVEQADIYPGYFSQTMKYCDIRSNKSFDILVDVYRKSSAYYDTNIEDWINSWDYKMIVCDKQMYEYYITTGDDNSNDGDIFGSGGINPLWNVQGDGIGLFIGCNSKFLILPQ